MLAFRNYSTQLFSCCLVVFICLAHHASARRSLPRKTGEEMPKERQPDDVDSGNYDDLYMASNDPYCCTRICKDGEKPRVCYYDFHVECYSVLTEACKGCPHTRADCYLPQCVAADGFEKTILTVNRRLPGPSIQVCKGDTVVVDVHNQMPAQSLTIHWHGQHQHKTPWFDGVPMVTQCPILEAQTFQYRFVAEEAGTHFWHSHDGLQKLDGCTGSLIVREPDSQNPLCELYDYDLPSHVCIIEDWMHEFALDLFPGASGYHRTYNIGQHPDSYLINGQGCYPLPANSLGNAFNAGMTPVHVFWVEKGKKYRFRLIAATCTSCPFALSIQNHPLTVISSDECPLQPIGYFDSITMTAGQRYDVLLDCNQQIAQYYIYVRGFDQCAEARQVAILRYKGANYNVPPAAYAPANAGKTFNIRNAPCDGSGNGKCFSESSSLVKNPDRISQRPNKFQVLYFGFYNFTVEEQFQKDEFVPFYVPAEDLLFAGYVNNCSQSVAPSPVLTQYEDIPPEIFCSSRPECDGSTFCECLNILRFNVNDLVEFIIVDTKSLPRTVTHPFHVHGHIFYVVEQGLFEESYEKELPALIARLKRSDRVVDKFLPKQDTVQVPSVGYAVVRVLLDNPGTWLFHCHFAYHAVVGMETIFQVGPFNNRLAEVPVNFPRCCEYTPAFNPEPECCPVLINTPVHIVHQIGYHPTHLDQHIVVHPPHIG